MTATCRSCGAPIIWARTVNGKAMPLDAEPTDAGNVSLVNGVAYVGEQLALPPCYTSHFATCPDAPGWRK